MPGQQGRRRRRHPRPGTTRRNRRVRARVPPGDNHGVLSEDRIRGRQLKNPQNSTIYEIARLSPAHVRDELPPPPLRTIHQILISKTIPPITVEIFFHVGDTHGINNIPEYSYHQYGYSISFKNENNFPKATLPPPPNKGFLDLIFLHRCLINSFQRSRLTRCYFYLIFILLAWKNMFVVIRKSLSCVKTI